MTRSKLWTIEDLVDKLDMGKATLKFILHRFSPWLTTQIVNEETCYCEQAVTTLLKIRKFLDTGMLPEQVEQSLAQETQMPKAEESAQHLLGNQGAAPLDAESVSVFKDLFQVFIEKQGRIALAQEALARVEERKADAMEKRAAAEEKKAAAMTNIALALQDMNQRHGHQAPRGMEIAGHALETMALEEALEPDDNFLDTGFDENEHLLEDPVPIEDPFKDQDHEGLGDIGSSDMDDLSLLVNEPCVTAEDIDDLSSLIDSVSAVSDPHSDLDDLESLLGDAPSAPGTDSLSNDIDDLSSLVDPDSPAPSEPGNTEEDLDDLFKLVSMDSCDTSKEFNEGLDDLSRLIEPDGEAAVGDLDDLSALLGESAHSVEEPIDDLSALLEPADINPPGDLDDLSALVETTQQPSKKAEAMDDLSLLAGGAGEKQEPLQEAMDTPTDDLWSLVSDKKNSNQESTQPVGSANAPETDNLSALLTDSPDKSGPAEKTAQADQDSQSSSKDGPSEASSIKPDISPEQDMAKYKAAVMKIIIELKGQGLTAHQTTDRLNHDGVATLSGKPAWAVKAIEKIYGFIESVK